jgi:antirestriction protein ArdC
MTFKQALELGAHVRKGEHGSLVVYASSVTRTETDEKTGKEEERDIPFMKGYIVFNVEQIEGLPSHYCAPAEPRLESVQRIERAERFVAATGAPRSAHRNRLRPFGYASSTVNDEWERILSPADFRH